MSDFGAELHGGDDGAAAYVARTRSETLGADEEARQAWQRYRDSAPRRAAADAASVCGRVQLTDHVAEAVRMTQICAHSSTAVTATTDSTVHMAACLRRSEVQIDHTNTTASVQAVDVLSPSLLGCAVVWWVRVGVPRRSDAGRKAAANGLCATNITCAGSATMSAGTDPKQ